MPQRRARANAESGIRRYRWRRLEVANLYDDPSHAHQISTLVGTAPGCRWSLHVDEAAFRDNPRRIIRLEPLPELIEPIRGVHYSGKRDIVAFRHFAAPRNQLLPQSARRNTEKITARISVPQPDLPQMPALYELIQAISS